MLYATLNPLSLTVGFTLFPELVNGNTVYIYDVQDSFPPDDVISFISYCAQNTQQLYELIY